MINMSKTPGCKSSTVREKIWGHEQYYIGDTDKDKRRIGTGEIHWTGAESIEWYTGEFYRGAMHGPGEYRWRHRGPDGAFVSYEGRFHANRMHGYGTMSYPDGRTFTGLYHENYRWGPGIESHVSLKEDVGFWRGSQIIRLVWRPAGPSITLDLMTGYNGKAIVEQFRIMLVQASKTIGKTNSAIELLKSYGADPLRASEVWPKLYMKHYSDLESVACYVKGFEYEFYGRKMHSLEEVTRVPDPMHSKNITDSDETKDSTADDDSQATRYFAWNNSETMVHMMKHCFRNEEQRDANRIKLAKFLNGPRELFKPAGKHEIECRMLLMASYLGRITNVAQLLNERNIHPDVSDMQGNTAVMYASCGDKADVVNFLVGAGVNVNCYNDSCCTPLGVALIRFACVLKNVAPNGVVQAILPPRVLGEPTPIPQLSAVDWNINREVSDEEFKRKSIINKGEKKSKSTMVLLDLPASARKRTKSKEQNYSQESFSENRILYLTITEEYIAIVNSLFIVPNVIVPYIFEVHDMVKEVEANEFLPKPTFGLDNNASKRFTKAVKDIKPSREILWQTATEDIISENSIEREKMEMISKIKRTILQLLANGADPRLVRCPHPALFIAVTAGCTDLIHHLVLNGVDIKETYPQVYGYTALDVAISRPFTHENTEVIRTLLENGADANHRLQYQIDTPGPTLLHAVLARKIESRLEDDILHHLIELLLNHNCNPGIQFRGHSAIEVAMIKNLELLDTFIKSPRTNLNEVINSSNQTALVKMFSLPFFKITSGTDRFNILTNLLLYGADPLIECRNGDESYRNIFVFAKMVVASMETGKALPSAAAKAQKNGKADSKKTLSKQDAKGKNDEVKGQDLTKSKGKVDDISDYKAAIDLVKECSRILHIRWLQAKLMKELISVIYRYKHRQWNIILKEHRDRQSVGLWLTPQRCLEIWDILNTTKRNIYKDDRILTHLLCIVQFCNNKYKLSQSTPEINPAMTAVEKRNMEADMRHLLKEHKIVSKFKEDAEAWKGLYVKPELAVGVDDKFNICFECAFPLAEANKILCKLCCLVSFCSFECMKVNVDRPCCHPCSDYLKKEFCDEIFNETETIEI